MKAKTLAIFLIFTVCLAGCSSNSSNNSQDSSTQIEQPIQVTLYGNDSQNSLNMIFDFNNSEILCTKSDKVVKLNTPSMAINPGYFFDNHSNYNVAKDSAGKEFDVFGATAYIYAQLPSGKETVYVFKRRGQGENRIGMSKDAKIWLIKEDNSTVQIGKVSLRDIITIAGEKKSEIMHKNIGSNTKWITDIGDKICEEQIDGKLNQVGWVNWRVITLSNGEKHTILMTKRMSENSKWIGRYDGLLYQDK